MTNPIAVSPLRTNVFTEQLAAIRDQLAEIGKPLVLGDVNAGAEQLAETVMQTDQALAGALRQVVDVMAELAAQLDALKRPDLEP